MKNSEQKLKIMMIYQVSLKLLTNLFQNSYGCRQVVKVFRVYFYRKSRDDASLTTHNAGTLC